MRSGLFQYDPQPGVVPPGSITNAELADMAARTVKVNATNASTSPQDLQGTTPYDVLRVNAAGDGLEWGEPVSDAYVLKVGDTMTGLLTVNLNAAAAPTPGGSPGVHIAAADGSNSRIAVDAFGAQPQTYMRRANGTNAAPSAVVSGDVFAQFGGYGYGATGYITGARARIECVATENWSDTVSGSKMTFLATTTGTASITTVAELNPSVGFTLNAGLVIDNNRLFRLRQYTVATLPAAGTAGRKAAVTDALAPAYGVAVAGAGAVNVPVYDNGAAWVTV